MYVCNYLCKLNALGSLAQNRTPILTRAKECFPVLLGAHARYVIVAHAQSRFRVKIADDILFMYRLQF